MLIVQHLNKWQDHLLDMNLNEIFGPDLFYLPYAPLEAAFYFSSTQYSFNNQMDLCIHSIEITFLLLFMQYVAFFCSLKDLVSVTLKSQDSVKNI